ncbi:MAG: hypothetical protein LAO20_17075 [Acidobacteriia bacterium]|nr:hypothetical protein [Terriglobia bacterium]
MTLIVSLRMNYGALILADSQETAKDRDENEFKYGVLKSEPEVIRGFQYVIAGGGDGDYIDSLCEEFKRALVKSKCHTLKDFRNLLQRRMKILSKQAPVSEIGLIVAASKDNTWDVWRSTQHNTLIPTINNQPTLVGFATQLYQHIANTLFAHANSTAQAVLVGLRILELARQTSTCVDAPFSGVIVNADYVAKVNNGTLSELTDSLTTFGANMDKLLLSSADTSIPPEEFVQQLDTFKEHALHMRKEYLEALAEAEDMEGIALIPLFPAGTTVTKFVDSSGKIMTSVKDDPEYRETLKTLFEEARKKRGL